MTRFDPVRAIEACYALGDDRAWAGEILEALSPLDQGGGIMGCAFDIRDRAHFQMSVLGATGNLAQHVETLGRTYYEAPWELVQRHLGPSPCVDLASRRAAQDWAATRTAMEAAGVAEGLGINAVDHDLNGVLFWISVAGGYELAPRTRHQLTRVSAHMLSARRLRSWLRCGRVEDDSVEAVLDPQGRLHHAAGEAKGSNARPRLIEAVRRSERARGRLRETDPEEAVDLWKGLVGGRWSLMDHHESDGRRFILARRNEPGVRDPKALVPRERDVLSYAAMGHSNKYIGYLLGIAPSTVATHLASAAAKRGMGSRRQLIDTFGRAGPGSRTGSGESA